MRRTRFFSIRIDCQGSSKTERGVPMQVSYIHTVSYLDRRYIRAVIRFSRYSYSTECTEREVVGRATVGRSTGSPTVGAHTKQSTDNRPPERDWDESRNCDSRLTDYSRHRLIYFSKISIFLPDLLPMNISPHRCQWPNIKSKIERRSSHNTQHHSSCHRSIIHLQCNISLKRNLSWLIADCILNSFWTTG
jgi:hypothetical protein